MKNPVMKCFLMLVLTAAILFGLSTALEGTAQKNAAAVDQAVMEALLPGSTEFAPEEYVGDDANIRSVQKGQTGFVVTVSTHGYVDEITMMVGVSNEGTVTGLVVTDQHETSGLGGKILTDVDFLGQFLYGGTVEVGTDVDAITGATVTSKAVARCVNSAVAFVTGADVSSSATEWGNW